MSEVYTLIKMMKERCRKRGVEKKKHLRPDTKSSIGVKARVEREIDKRCLISGAVT